MDRQRAPILLLLILLVANAFAVEPNSQIAAFETLATAGLISEDPVGESLTRERAAALVADAVNKAEGKALEVETIEALRLLVAEFSSELIGMGIKLDAMEQRIDAVQKASGQKRHREGIWSEAGGFIEYTPGNGGSPRVYNAIRFQPWGDPETRFSFMLYLQNGLGTTDFDTLAVSADEFYLSTKLFWQNYKPITLQLGNFWFCRSPFTIYRPYRVEDVTKEARRSFDGIMAETDLWGLNWQGFVARLVKGNGQDFDRFLLYNYVSTPLPGGDAGLTFMKITDDLHSAEKEIGAYDATLVGFALSQRGDLGGKGYELTGEANLCKLDPDLLSGPIASTEYAIRLEGRWSTTIPLVVNYYAISDAYPIQYTAIQTVGENYIYQYEENPWELHYLANLQRLEGKIDAMPLGDFVKATFRMNRAKEISGERPKAFGFYGLNVNMDLGIFPLPLTRNGSLELELGEYSTRKPEETELKQRHSAISLARPIAGVNFKIGYEQDHLAGKNRGEVLAELTQVPFVQAQFSPLPGSSLKWRWRSQTEKNSKRTQKKELHRLVWDSNIGPATWFRAYYDLTLGEQQIESKNLRIEYRSGF